LSLVAVVGIIFLGIRFLIAPQTGAQGCGVPLEKGNGIAFALTKGIRDIFSGAVTLPFLLGRQRRAVA
jgi:hypothetical protein